MLKKTTLLAVLAVFFFSVLGGALYYNSSGKKETNNSNASVDNKTELGVPVEDTKMPAPEQKPAEPAKGGEAAAAAQTTGSSSPRNTPQQKSSSGTTDPLRSQIEEKYIACLQSLASGYEGRLNGLMAAAVSEYQVAKQANPNADITPIINKYYSAGKALEAECDSQFYPLLAEFESALSAHSFPLDMAVQAREAYEARKSGKAGQITTGKP